MIRFPFASAAFHQVGGVALALISIGLAATSVHGADASMKIEFPGASWQTASPESQGVDPDKLAQAIEHLRQVCAQRGTDDTLIVKNGFIIWQGPHVDRRQIVFSCTKSFLSTCLGLLWDDGKLTPETLAHQRFPELAKEYPGVTLRHLGTLTAGVELGEEPLALAAPRHEPGAYFHYSRQSDLLAAVLTRIAGRSLEGLFLERIGTPIGITREDMDWQTLTEDHGIEVNGGAGRPASGVLITPLAMARFGWLYANGGNWNGKQLISRKYIEYATVPQTSAKIPPHDPKGWYVKLPGNYGLNWWTNGLRPDGKRFWPHAPDYTFAAQGNRNNVCFIIPEWKMVVVRLGGDQSIDMELYDRVFELLAP